VLLLLSAVLCIGGCGWAAADGPWNDRDQPIPESILVPVSGTVCSPSGLRGVPGIEARLVDPSDVVVGEAITDPWGAWEAELPEGRFTLNLGGGGSFQAFGVVLVSGSAPIDYGQLCLERGTPKALLFRSAVAEATDLLGQRLSGLGLVHVHSGPSDSDSAAQILASPAGLVEYGLVALLGGLDFETLSAEVGALDGLRDHLGAGGGIFLGADAWPVMDALAPGAVSRIDSVASGGWVPAEVVDPTLAEQLQWPTVGVPLPQDGTLLRAGPGGVPLLTAWVPTGAEGLVQEVDLVIKVSVDGGTVLLSSFLAPPPRADAWWMGDPSEVQLPNGAWDGRGGVLDRLLLQL